MANTEDPIWTIHRLLDWTTSFFGQHKLATPRLDAEVLLAYCLGLDRLALYLHYEEPLSQQDLTVYRSLIQKRIKGEPIAYITGNKEFFSISLAVTPSVLIPRPETEHVIEYALDYLKQQMITAPNKAVSILEIGTGSGNICITLAKHLPKARIFSIDISTEALNVAKKNIDTYAEFSSKISLVQGDLLSCIHRERAKFHLVISNPPYIPEESMEQLPPEVKDYEPPTALNGGREGIKILENIIINASKVLLDDGLLAMEIGENQADRLLEMAPSAEGYRQCWILPDYAGKPRVFMAKK